MVSSEDDERRRRIRRTTLLLALIALAFYVGFILMSVMRGTR
ncbi:MAG TPA: hypothetical protein VMG11_09775 [Steroidobacteraceae bacterium]|nr:hypothetical protein [Steroidobacteraceae bacterium]